MIDGFAFFFFLGIVFLRLESLSCFSSERVLIFQLGDFEFLFLREMSCLCVRVAF